MAERLGRLGRPRTVSGLGLLGFGTHHRDDGVMTPGDGFEGLHLGVSPEVPEIRDGVRR